MKVHPSSAAPAVLVRPSDCPRWPFRVDRRREVRFAGCLGRRSRREEVGGGHGGTYVPHFFRSSPPGAVHPIPPIGFQRIPRIRTRRRPSRCAALETPRPSRLPHSRQKKNHHHTTMSHPNVASNVWTCMPKVIMNGILSFYILEGSICNYAGKSIYSCPILGILHPTSPLKLELSSTGSSLPRRL